MRGLRSDFEAPLSPTALVRTKAGASGQRSFQEGNVLRCLYAILIARIVFPYALLPIAATLAWAGSWALAIITLAVAGLVLYRRHWTYRATRKAAGFCRACSGTGRFRLTVPTMVYVLNTGDTSDVRCCPLCGGSGTHIPTGQTLPTGERSEGDPCGITLIQPPIPGSRPSGKTFFSLMMFFCAIPVAVLAAQAPPDGATIGDVVQSNNDPAAHLLKQKVAAASPYGASMLRQVGRSAEHESVPVAIAGGDSFLEKRALDQVFFSRHHLLDAGADYGQIETRNPAAWLVREQDIAGFSGEQVPA